MVHQHKLSGLQNKMCFSLQHAILGPLKHITAQTGIVPLAFPMQCASSFMPGPSGISGSSSLVRHQGFSANQSILDPSNSASLTSGPGNSLSTNADQSGAAPHSSLNTEYSHSSQRGYVIISAQLSLLPDMVFHAVLLNHTLKSNMEQVPWLTNFQGGTQAVCVNSHSNVGTECCV